MLCPGIAKPATISRNSYFEQQAIWTVIASYTCVSTSTSIRDSQWKSFVRKENLILKSLREWFTNFPEYLEKIKNLFP